jgi:threonine/homoserine/homoserine lactone efflux protein
LSSTNIAAWVYTLAALFIVLLLVLWVLLPFAIFGMKDLLRKLLREQTHTNTLLERLAGARSAITDREDVRFVDTRPGASRRT